MGRRRWARRVSHDHINQTTWTMDTDSSTGVRRSQVTPKRKTCVHGNNDEKSCPLCWCRKHAPDFVVTHYEAVWDKLKKAQKSCDNCGAPEIDCVVCSVITMNKWQPKAIDSCETCKHHACRSKEDPCLTCDTSENNHWEPIDESK